jgi:hypothetical protein
MCIDVSSRRKRRTIETTADAGINGVNLSFATSRTPTLPTKGRTIDHIGFEVTDLAAFVKQLEAKGQKFDVAYREIPAIGLKIAYITDPQGTYIELTEGYSMLTRNSGIRIQNSEFRRRSSRPAAVLRLLLLSLLSLVPCPP